MFFIFFYVLIQDEARILGRTLGYTGRILHFVLCIPCDLRTHRPVHISGCVEPFTIQVSDSANKLLLKQ